MTNQKVIEFLERKAKRAHPCDIEYYDRAIFALRENIEQEKNEPLTLDELWEMDGEPVWVYDSGVFLCCALIEVDAESVWLTNNLGGRTGYETDADLECDGITVYRRPLKEEDISDD